MKPTEHSTETNADFRDFLAASELAHDRRETATILFLSFRHYLKGVAFRYAPMAHLADEIVQQVYIEFISNLDRFRIDLDVKSLLSVMTRNIARDTWRRETRHFLPNMQSVAEHIRQLAEEQGATNYPEELEILSQCLEKAPEKTRELIRLHYIRQISIQDLAERLDMNANSIYRAIYRLRDKLRDCVERVHNGGSAYV